MIRQRFDPTKPLRVAVYLRMSSDKQNPRSPEQQLQTIQETIRRSNLAWTVVATYRDDAVSGRKIRARKGFQKLLQDVRTETLVIDAILVDTFERFGRAEELAMVRRELHHHHGVLVLTADTHFADPTSVSGKMLSTFESLRAIEENRVKAHNVLRGKRDAARQRRWPGGPPPFGYRLKSVLVERNGREEVDYCLLVPDPETAWIIQKLFATALEKGWGSTRLARMLNDDQIIPDKFKPFYDQTVNYWLRQAIYYGELVWEKHATDIIADRRVIERNPEDVVLRVPDFCEALVPRPDWDKVQAQRRIRSERARQTRQAKHANSGKQIKALTPGLALTYLLSGLVFCGHCHRSMVISATSAYTTKDGKAKRYASYACPGFTAGVCCNKMRVPEVWLRKTVVGLIKRRLFSRGVERSGKFTLDELNRTTWFAPLIDQIQNELKILSCGQHERLPNLVKEGQELRTQIQGWSCSLANPELSSVVRQQLENDLGKALQRQQELDHVMSRVEAAEQNANQLVDPEKVVERLNHLDETLQTNNPSQGNVELSLHIDSIRCAVDGQVVVRTCKLGVLAGTTELLEQGKQKPIPEQNTSPNCMPATPRRRARRRQMASDAPRSESEAAAEFAADVNRFAGLGPEWFWEDTFHIPPREIPSWARDHASAVASLRAEGMTHEQLARNFQVSVPTIRKALGIAAATDNTIDGLPRKMPRRRWAEDHAAEVAKLKAQGLGTNELVAHFKKSDTTIRQALRYAEQLPDNGESRQNQHD